MWTRPGDRADDAQGRREAAHRREEFAPSWCRVPRNAMSVCMISRTSSGSVPSMASWMPFFEKRVVDVLRFIFQRQQALAPGLLGEADQHLDHVRRRLPSCP